jgi:hypothetical protein
MLDSCRALAADIEDPGPDLPRRAPPTPQAMSPSRLRTGRTAPLVG